MQLSTPEQLLSGLGGGKTVLMRSMIKTLPLPIGASQPSVLSTCLCVGRLRPRVESGPPHDKLAKSPKPNAPLEQRMAQKPKPRVRLKLA